MALTSELDKRKLKKRNDEVEVEVVEDSEGEDADEEGEDGDEEGCEEDVENLTLKKTNPGYYVSLPIKI